MPGETDLAKLLAGMGVNPVSAFHHDHLFVPAERADDALRLLQQLAAEAVPRYQPPNSRSVGQSGAIGRKTECHFADRASIDCSHRCGELFG